MPTGSGDAYDAVIVGGGVIGLACAWRAAQRGLAVTVVDPAPASGATRAAAGMLAPVTEVHYGEQGLLRLTLAAARRYPAFVAELEEATGRGTGYRACGTLAVALDAGDRAVLEDLRRFQDSLGLDTQPLTARECRRLEPLLAPDVQGGVLVAGDHQVDGRRLASALMAALGQAGGSLVTASVRRLLLDGGAVAGVELDDGSTLAAERVVLAAGARCGQLAGVPPEALPPVRPVKGQILRLAVPAAYRPFLSRTVRATVRGCAVYLVPREDGELVVGATTEEVGFDEQVTAGGVHQLLRDAHLVLPAVGELPLVETRAGLRPGSPDNAPLVGATGVPGLLVATGHGRNGVLLAPLTAEAIAAALTGGEPPEVAAPFAPTRFAAAGAAR